MTEQIYTDKEILADALTAEKAATNNYNAFANECVHDSVRGCDPSLFRAGTLHPGRCV